MYDFRGEGLGFRASGLRGLGLWGKSELSCALLETLNVYRMFSCFHGFFWTLPNYQALTEHHAFHGLFMGWHFARGF